MQQKKPHLPKKRALPPGFLTTRDLAEFLQLHPVTIRKYARDQDFIPRIRVRGKYYFSEDEVAVWLERHTVRPRQMQNSPKS